MSADSRVRRWRHNALDIMLRQQARLRSCRLERNARIAAGRTFYSEVPLRERKRD